MDLTLRTVILKACYCDGETQASNGVRRAAKPFLSYCRDKFNGDYPFFQTLSLCYGRARQLDKDTAPLLMCVYPEVAYMHRAHPKGETELSWFL